MDTCHSSLCIHINYFIRYYEMVRQKTNLSAFLFEYIAGMTIGDIAPKYLQGSIQNFFTASLRYSFSLWYLLTGILSLKNKTARDFFEGKSTVLIKDGKILEDNLKKEKYTSDELLELLRGKVRSA